MKTNKQTIPLPQQLKQTKKKLNKEKSILSSYTIFLTEQPMGCPCPYLIKLVRSVSSQFLVPLSLTNKSASKQTKLEINVILSSSYAALR